MKKCILIGCVLLGFNMIIADSESSLLREKIARIEQKQKKHRDNIDQMGTRHTEEVRELAIALLDRCECAILKGISDPEAGIECEKEKEYLIDTTNNFLALDGLMISERACIEKLTYKKKKLVEELKNKKNKE